MVQRCSAAAILLAGRMSPAWRRWAVRPRQSAKTGNRSVIERGVKLAPAQPCANAARLKEPGWNLGQSSAKQARLDFPTCRFQLGDEFRHHLRGRRVEGQVGLADGGSIRRWTEPGSHAQSCAVRLQGPFGPRRFRAEEGLLAGAIMIVIGDWRGAPFHPDKSPERRAHQHDWGGDGQKDQKSAHGAGASRSGYCYPQLTCDRLPSRERVTLAKAILASGTAATLRRRRNIRYGPTGCRTRMF